MHGKVDSHQSEPAENESVSVQLSMVWRAFMASPLRNRLLLLSAGLLCVIVATAFGQVLLNRWNKPFYDAIERRDLPAFFNQLILFGEIAGGLLVLNVTQSWLNQTLHLKLREGLTRDLIGQWLQPPRAFRLANAGAIGVNPDQRMHEDARHLADLSADLGIGLIQAAILLASFVGVLWAISGSFVLHVWGRDIAVPGYMVWAAVLYAGVASCLSWLAGRRLIKLDSERYAREAELRFSLVHVNEHVDAVRLAGGEAAEEIRLNRNLNAVVVAVRQIVSATVRLTWVTAGYGWITVVAPIVIASPIYFSGRLSFGGLMMAAAAFSQVHASLRWFVDHIGSIADWRATLMRVANFRAAVLRAGSQQAAGEQITRDVAESNQLVFENLAIAATGGPIKLSDTRVEIAPGDHVLVTGGPGEGKTLLFKAIAGLRTVGSGRIGLPKDQAISFIPSKPYMPPGPLRDALAYPGSDRPFTDPELVTALEKLGLGLLSTKLEQPARWDRELNDDEQRLLAFARLALRKPDWIIIDGALDPMRGEARRRVLSLLEHDLAGSAIINIGQVGHADKFFTRTVQLRVEHLPTAAHAG